MNPETDSSPASLKKTANLLFLATVGGLGYLPIVPGTFGSLAGSLVYLVSYSYERFGYFPTDYFPSPQDYQLRAEWTIGVGVGIAILLAVIGMWVSSRTARFWARKDPQFVVIDELSGQHLALVLGSVLPTRWGIAQAGWLGYPLAAVPPHSVLSWKYLLLGLILFRGFDIWKPFPVRQAESLPGGWGIMTDDWIAAIYAAIGIWIARALGL